MTTRTIRGKLDRLALAQSKIPKYRTERYDFSFKPEYFTDQERERYTALVSKVTEPGTMKSLPDIEIRQRLSSKLFTYAELDELLEYTQLYEAMKAGNAKETARLRRRLHTSVEELIARFQALDTSMLPHNPPGIPVKEGNCIHYLHRHAYDIMVRYNIREKGYIYSDTVGRSMMNKVWIWIEHYQEMGWL